jgi:hypothetical protein
LVGSAAGAAAPPQATSNGSSNAAANKAAARFHDEVLVMCSDPFEENGKSVAHKQLSHTRKMKSA